MRKTVVKVVESLRLPALWRKVCLSAGVPLAGWPCTGRRFVARSGEQPAETLAELHGEAFGFRSAGVAIERGYAMPCPQTLRAELERTAGFPSGRSVLVAIERRDDGRRLVGISWAALPEEEPAPQELFRAAVAAISFTPASAVG